MHNVSTDQSLQILCLEGEIHIMLFDAVLFIDFDGSNQAGDFDSLQSQQHAGLINPGSKVLITSQFHAQVKVTLLVIVEIHIEASEVGIVIKAAARGGAVIAIYEGDRSVESIGNAGQIGNKDARNLRARCVENQRKVVVLCLLLIPIVLEHILLGRQIRFLEHQTEVQWPRE